MATAIPVLASGLVGPGTFSLISTPVAVGVNGVAFAVDVSLAADPLPAVTIMLEGSLDGGVTWISAGGAGRTTGSKTIADRGGGTITPTTIEFGTQGFGDFWLATTNPNRRVRGSVTVDAAVLIAATITLLP